MTPQNHEMTNEAGEPLPPPGEHGGDGPALAAALGVPPQEVLDLSASLNPLAPPVAPLVRQVAGAVAWYPDPRRATSALAEALGVGPGRLLITNGASEAIALVARELGAAAVVGPEFSAWQRHLAAVVPPGPRSKRVRSNPNNPTGALAGAEEAADAWDEAFYQLATGSWTRGDADKGAFVIGSLTKLFACPGLRLGYVIAPGGQEAGRLARHQPLWPVNSLALEVLPKLLDAADLPGWASGLAVLRAELASVFARAGFEVRSGSAPWVLVKAAAWLRPALARQGVLVRDCANFGLPGWARVAVPGPAGLERLEKALSKALSSDVPALGETASRLGERPGGKLREGPGDQGRRPRGPSPQAAGPSGRATSTAHEPLRPCEVPQAAAPGGAPRPARPGPPAVPTAQRGPRGLPSTLQGSLLVCGTASDVGKSRLVAGLCRALARRGVKVAPFKAQNMSLNSTVTPAGHEIARSQAAQAAAACTEPDVLMGPVLLKPSGEATSQLVVMGRPAGKVNFGVGWQPQSLLEQVVLPALSELRRRYDVVVAEGAGGAGEVNLLDADIANLPLASRAGIPAVVVADIEKGGAFAALLGTQAILPTELREQLAGFIINKFRGNQGLLQPGIDELEHRTGLRCFGVVPHLGRLALDEEDSLALAQAPWRGPYQHSPLLDVAVIALPHMANFTDFSPLEMEPAVALRYVAHPGQLGCPDLVVLPGSKATVEDLRWLRAAGLASALSEARSAGSALLGICAGYQMLGQKIIDQVESASGEAEGLGLLPVVTEFEAEKTARWRHGKAKGGEVVNGFEIHHGQVRARGRLPEWFWLEDAPPCPAGEPPAAGLSAGGGHATNLGPGAGLAQPWELPEGAGSQGPRRGVGEPEGVADEVAGLWATSLHGLFENDGLRASFLTEVARRRGKAFRPSGLVFARARDALFELLADTVESHLDLSALFGLIGQAGPR